MGGWSWRMAEPRDAEAFTKWLALNPQIDKKDIEAAQKKSNPTVVYFAAESPDGVVMAFAPVYLQMAMAYLVFNPDSSVSDKCHAMQTLIDGTSAFAVQFGVHEITATRHEGCGVSDWAMKHGFDEEPQQHFKLYLNKVLAKAKEEDPWVGATAGK